MEPEPVLVNMGPSRPKEGKALAKDDPEAPAQRRSLAWQQPERPLPPWSPAHVPVPGHPVTLLWDLSLQVRLCPFVPPPPLSCSVTV